MDSSTAGPSSSTTSNSAPTAPKPRKSLKRKSDHFLNPPIIAESMNPLADPTGLSVGVAAGSASGAGGGGGGDVDIDAAAGGSGEGVGAASGSGTATAGEGEKEGRPSKRVSIIAPTDPSTSTSSRLDKGKSRASLSQPSAPASSSTSPSNADAMEIDPPQQTQEPLQPQQQEQEQEQEEEEVAEEDKFGPHYKFLMQALEVAIRKGANRWTAKDLKSCYPLLSASKEMSEQFDVVYTRTAAVLREKMIKQSHELIDHYQLGPALSLLSKSINDAKDKNAAVLAAREKVDAAKAGENGSGKRVEGAEKELVEAEGRRRLGVWRPDLTPQVITIATHLPRYDAIYSQLREEYLELYKDCDGLAGELEGKQKRIDEIKDGVVEGSKQLEAAVLALEGVPSEQMMTWMEDVTGNLSGSRTAT